MNENQVIMMNDDEEIDLIELFSYLWKKATKIVLLFVIGCGLAAGFVFLRSAIETPSYQATAKLYVNSTSAEIVDFTDLAISNEFVPENGRIITYREDTELKDYAELMTSRELLEILNSDLDLEYAIEDLQEMVKGEPVNGAHIINVNVTASDPELATTISNTLVELAPDYFSKVFHEQKPQIHIIERAEVPGGPINSLSYIKYTLLGGILGALLSIMYYAIRFVVNNKISTAEEMIQYLGKKPITVIPNEINISVYEKGHNR